MARLRMYIPRARRSQQRADLSILTSPDPTTYHRAVADRGYDQDMANIIKPAPGDVSTEPVSTAQQSHVDGRVGPPTIS
jgi:hypothetical protein